MLKRTLLSCAFAGLGLALVPSNASAEFLDFTVNETVVPGTGAAGFTFVADKMNGLYRERITFASDPSLGATTFEAMAIADFSAWASNEGTVPIGTTMLANVPGIIPTQYGLYALVSFTGTYTGTTLLGNTAAVSLYVDPDLNTSKTLGADGDDAITVAGNGEDLLVLSSATLVSGFGSAFAAGGFFDITFADLNITAFGQTFFPDLPLLNIVSNVDGDLDVLTPSPAPGEPFTFLVTGDVSNVFQAVPEPATLTLLGMGLAGARWAARRRKTKAAVVA
jgi:hypothetical protein